MNKFELRLIMYCSKFGKRVEQISRLLEIDNRTYSYHWIIRTCNDLCDRRLMRKTKVGHTIYFISTEGGKAKAWDILASEREQMKQSQINTITTTTKPLSDFIKVPKKKTV